MGRSTTGNTAPQPHVEAGRAPAPELLPATPVPVATISSELIATAIKARALLAWPCRRSGDREAYHVRVLGPVVVAAPSLTAGATARAQELVTLLAVSAGHRATRDRLRGQLGRHPDEPMPEGYFRQTCTRARALLGPGRDGQPLLRHDHGAYALHPGVVIDWEHFQQLVAQAKEPSHTGIQELRRALSLVRGEPLEDCDYRWIDPVLIEHIRADIVDAAELLAQRSGADPAMAAWAACRGLLADPYAEQLYRHLMTSAHALGHTRGVHLAYELCVEALAILDLAPHQQTTALYRSLM